MSDHSAIMAGVLWGLWERENNVKKQEKRELQKAEALDNNDIRLYFELIGIDIDSKKTEDQFRDYEGEDGMRERWEVCIEAKKLSRDELYDKGYKPAFLNYIRTVNISELEGWIDDGDFLLSLYRTWKKNIDKYLLIQKQKVIESREKEAEVRKEMNGRISTGTVVFMFLASVLVVSAIASGIS